MASITNTQQEAGSKSSGGYDDFLQKLNFSYFALISMTITIGSIIGGIAAMYILQNDAPIAELAICMTLAMANNVAAIGQAPVKWLVNIFALAVIANTILILINL